MDDDGGQLIPVAGAPGGPSVRGGSCHGRPVCPQASPKRRGRDASTGAGVRVSLTESPWTLGDPSARVEDNAQQTSTPSDSAAGAAT